jgi:hypothetical protein
MTLKSFGRVGAAIIVLVITLTIWNAMEYKRRMTLSGFVSDQVMAERQRNVAPVYVEREVLIVGMGVAAWFLVGRSKRA